ncbi:cellulase family glycosylhydrolase [Janthinobacterium sp. B9-8]|uniref:cellulase family glycosylhydrolase n=1 Tax=Janthinobacterium sp. B9-8 TaxID=1236179 RepID=UPI00061D1CA5|nr:cellulase family glycosylhydrolase [Janthinobacterium sp. B9-8]AMC36802.1 hypothetical protein VN23_20520 [Janthinobacterium sp. B9-8]
MTKLLTAMRIARTLLLAMLTVCCLQSAVAVDEPLMLRKSNSDSLMAIPKTNIASRFQQEITASYFGVHVHRPDLNKAWPISGISSWRLWDLYVGWKDIEPSEGQYNFAKLDAIVEYSQKNNIRLLLPLGVTPVWASSRPQEKCAYGLGCAAEPANMAHWRSYVRKVATRYNNVIYNYEILNEVNLKPFWSGKWEALLEMQKIAYIELKAVNPKNRLVAPSMTGNSENELAKWDRYLAMGGGKYSDILAYHFYVPKSEPEAAYGLGERLYQIMGKNRQAHKPLWNTESGWLIENLSGPEISKNYSNEWRRLNQSQAVAYVLRANILALIQGVGESYWYSYDHGEMGLAEPKSKHKKAAAFAYQNFASQLIGSTPRGCQIDGLVVWICKFTDRQNAAQYFVWTTSDEVTKIARSKIGNISKVISFPMGRAEDIYSDEIAIGAVPVILK